VKKVDKSIPGWRDEYKSAGLMDLDGEDFYIRLVTVDMDPNDTLYMQIPESYETKTLARLLTDFFPSDSSAREDIKGKLEVEDFPELPEIYDYFCGIIEDDRCGRLLLEYSVNGGPTGIKSSEMVYEHLSLSEEKSSREKYRVLHLIVDMYNVPFGDLDDQVEAERMKRSFKGLFFYYLVFKNKLSVIDPSRIYDEVKESITYCEEENLVKCKKALIGNDMKLTLTDHGKSYFSKLYDEAQYYVSNFEIFSHVFTDDNFVRFNHVEGKDYRVQVMRHEGIDVYRAVMVMSLMNGTFEEAALQWEEEIRSPMFFARYLGSCVNEEIEISKKDFVSMISEGKKLRMKNDNTDY
jgi:hypothetical protein